MRRKDKSDIMIVKGRQKLKKRKRGKGSCEEEPHAKNYVSALTSEKRKKGEKIK